MTAAFARTETKLRLKKVRAAMRAVEDQAGDDAIHAARVAIRRLMACLRLFRPLLKKRSLAETRARLREVMQLCGEIRNVDVVLRLLDTLGVPSDAAVRKRLKKLRSCAQATLPEVVWEPDVRFRSVPPDFDLPLLRELAAKLCQAGSAAAAADADVQQIHQFRLQVKRLRYTSEILSAFYADGLERWLTVLRELQGCLGLINDCATAHELVRHPIEGLPALEAERIQTFRKFWRQHFNVKQRAQWVKELQQDGNLHTSPR